MGIANDEKRTNEIKQLLLAEEKQNYVMSLSNSSISDSISASPSSTTSHLSEYSSESKAVESEADNEQISSDSKKINIKENKLSKENYVLLLNDLGHLKSFHHSSPSTKSSPSINSTNLPSSINRSLTFIDQNSLEKYKFASNCPPNLNQQYFNSKSGHSSPRLAKSASTHCENQAASTTTYESANLPQSYSAVFNDKLNVDRHYAGFESRQFTQTNAQNDSQQTDNQLKISFKDSFYRKFLNKFRTDNELNFDHTNSKIDTKKPKLINLKRYSSIDLNREELESRTGAQSNYRQSNTYAEKLNDQFNDTPGPSGLSQATERTEERVDYLKSDLKIQQITNPLHPFYLLNCTDIDTWTVDNSNSKIKPVIDGDKSTNQMTSNYSALACDSSAYYESSENDKSNRQNSQTLEQTNNSKSNNNKKPILLPKLHNAYCTNTNSSHHHHHHKDYNDGSNCFNSCSNNNSTTRSSSTNSSNVSTSSSTDDKKTGSTLKPTVNNELSGSLSSVSSDLNTDPMLPICKICHLNGKDEDPLISPCRCAGTMQYIHCRCLMRWLEISKKKSRKLRCELCQYEYEWKKKFKVGNWQFPKCSRKDKFLHLAFIISVIIMICCALSIIVFFKIQEPVHRTDPRRYELTMNEPISVGLAMVFVFFFVMSLYAQVKARSTLYRLIANFIYLNQQWYINEYEKNSSTKKTHAGGGAEIV